MRTLATPVTLAVLGLGLLGGPARAEIVDVGVSFDVQNVNGSLVECPTDDQPYTISGHLVAPSSELSAADRVVTVYIPGGMTTERAVWRMPWFDGFYDFAARMAELGHASVVIDRLGFGESGIPHGSQSCWGGEAGVVHQVIQQLRQGLYQVQGTEAVAFDRVVLAGHSGGGFIAPIEAYSFQDVDALLLLASAADQGLPADLVAQMGVAETECAQGGEQKWDGEGPTGYEFFFHVGDEFFHDAEAIVQNDFKNRAEREPCGNLDSLGAVVAADAQYIGTIDVPVLHLAAEFDYAFPPDQVERQSLLYTGSPDNTVRVVENAGHVYMLERGLADGLTSAERVRLEISDWLTTREFLPEPGALPGVASGVSALWILRRCRRRGAGSRRSR